NIRPSVVTPPQLNRTLLGGGCLQSSASKCKRGNYEKMCLMSWKTWIRRPLPYFLERTLVGYTLASVRLIAKVNTSWCVTTLPLNNIAGTPSFILPVPTPGVFARDVYTGG